MVSISFSVYAIQILWVLLNSLGFSAYMKKFVLKHHANKISYYIEVKFYV